MEDSPNELVIMNTSPIKRILQADEYLPLLIVGLSISLILLYIATDLSFAQRTSDSSTVNGPSGQEYQTVKIGQQTWMAENLNSSHFANGDSIAAAESGQQWKQATENRQPAWAYYDNEPKNGPLYGKLYNWQAVSDPRGLCPEGWRVPTEGDWEQLLLHVGMTEKEVTESGWHGSIAGKLLSTRTQPAPHPRWIDPNELATNESGFSALPGGYRVGNPNYEEQQASDFRLLGEEAAIWVSDNTAYGLWSHRPEIFHGSSNLTEGFGFSVRCIKE